MEGALQSGERAAAEVAFALLHEADQANSESLRQLVTRVQQQERTYLLSRADAARKYIRSSRMWKWGSVVLVMTAALVAILYKFF